LAGLKIALASNYRSVQRYIDLLSSLSSLLTSGKTAALYRRRSPYNRAALSAHANFTTTMTMLSLLLFTPLVLASPLLQTPFFKDPKPPTSLPVVLWHGLGDNYNSKGMMNVAALINETYPGTFVHSIYLDEDTSKDRNAGFLGHVANQVIPLCLKVDDRLRLCAPSYRRFQSYIQDLMQWVLARVDNFSGLCRCCGTRLIM
jgi:Palmitoyl protein thioesterase